MWVICKCNVIFYQGFEQSQIWVSLFVGQFLELFPVEMKIVINSFLFSGKVASTPHLLFVSLFQFERLILNDSYD